MHISDGILSAAPLIIGGVVAASGIGVGLAKMETREIPRTAMMAAVFFTASLVHVPLGPANIHLVLIGLTGIVLGWSAWPAILVALFFQAVLFGFGGLTTLGVNACIMGIPAVCSWKLFHLLVGVGDKRRLTASGFITGACSVVLASLLLWAVLTFTGESFKAMAKVIFATQVPLALVEGGITMAVVVFLSKVYPEILTGKGK